MSETDWEFIEQHPIGTWRDYYVISLPICGCGSNEVADLLDECLRFAARERDANHKLPESDPWHEGFYRSLAHELAAKVLDGQGFIEHGTGIGWAWATDDGRRLLKMVDDWKAAHPELKGEG